MSHRSDGETRLRGRIHKCINTIKSSSSSTTTTTTATATATTTTTSTTIQSISTTNSNNHRSIKSRGENPMTINAYPHSHPTPNTHTHTHTHTPGNDGMPPVGHGPRAQIHPLEQLHRRIFLRKHQTTSHHTNPYHIMPRYQHSIVSYHCHATISELHCMLMRVALASLLHVCIMRRFVTVHCG